MYRHSCPRAHVPPYLMQNPNLPPLLFCWLSWASGSWDSGRGECQLVSSVRSGACHDWFMLPAPSTVTGPSHSVKTCNCSDEISSDTSVLTHMAFKETSGFHSFTQSSPYSIWTHKQIDELSGYMELCLLLNAFQVSPIWGSSINYKIIILGPFFPLLLFF